MNSILLSLDNTIENSYCLIMLKSFRCKETEKIWNREFSKKLPSDIQKIARRKLGMLDAASTLEDLKKPPSNRLEEYCGSKRDTYSIRINDQWRLCFKFKDREASEVEIVDYHP